MLMDQEDMLYAVDQSVREHHVRKRGAGPVGFEAPLQSLEGEAVLQHLVQGADRAFQGFSDGLADRRSHEGIEDIDQRSRVPLDRHLRGALDNGSERLAQPLIARSCLQNGGSEDSAHRSRELLGILESLLKLVQCGAFATGDDVAQFLEARIGREARHPGRKILIQTPSQINQERCEPLPVDPGLFRFQVRERERGIGHGKPSSPPLLGAVHAGTGSRRIRPPTSRPTHGRVSLESLPSRSAGLLGQLAIRALAQALGREILIEAFRYLDEQAGEEIAIRLYVAQLTEHPLDRIA